MKRLLAALLACALAAPATAATVRPYRHQPVERITDPLNRLILTEMDLSLQSAVGVVNVAIPVLGGGSFADNAFSVYNAGDPSKKLAFSVSGVSSGNTRTLTVPNANGTLPLIGYSQVWGGANYFKDDRLFVQDDGDTTKKALFQLSGITTGTTRTLTVPNASGTVPLLGFSQVWDGANYYKDDRWYVQDQADTSKRVQLQASGISTATTRTLTVQDASGTLPLLEASQTFTGAQTFNNTGGAGLAPVVNHNNAGSDPYLRFTDVANAANYLELQGPVISGTNVVTFPVSGTLVTTSTSTALTNKSINAGTINLTSQSADIGTTTITPSPLVAGVYEIEIFLMTTATDAGAGSITVTIGWTDAVGATSRAVTADPGATAFPLPLTATGRTSARVLLKRASGNITYATSGGGTYGTARYNLSIRVLGLGI